MNRSKTVASASGGWNLVTCESRAGLEGVSGVSVSPLFFRDFTVSLRQARSAL